MRNLLRLLSLAFILPAFAANAAEPPSTVEPHAGMLLFPDVSETQIVFVYGNDLWLVPREGGLAFPLASPPGRETFPRFSPDGRTVAFVGNYEGNRDIYCLPAAGGVPTRVTHHPGNEVVCEWSPEGEIIFFSSGMFGLSRQAHLLTVPPEGGLPAKLPVPYGANGAISADGEWLAYTPHSRDFRTWKRYRGGMATDIWLFNLKDHSSEKVTDWEGTDTYPMWHGKTLYYLSDAGLNHRLNIWAYDTATQERSQLTDFADFDVKFPAVGPGPDGQGEIVFQQGKDLWLLNLASKESQSVRVRIPGARPRIRPQPTQVNDLIFEWDISNSGKRALVEARGEIWSLPAENGSVLNLTRTSGAAERFPAWSPDGRWIAYFSDATGEYELYVLQSDGSKAARRLTSGGTAYRYHPTWSPDSEKIAFTDKTGAVYLHLIQEKTTRLVDKDPWAESPELSWSHDSGWLAYAKRGANRLHSLWLYNLDTDKTSQVTTGLFDDADPVFDRKGDFLFFVTSRRFEQPVYDDMGHGLGNTFVYTRTQNLAAVPLRADVKNPYLPENDAETWEDDKDTKKKDKPDDQKQEDQDKEKDEDKDKDEESDSDSEQSEAKDKDSESNGDDDAEEKDDEDEDAKKPEPLKIDLEGFERRAFKLPVSGGNFRRLSINHQAKLLYVRRAPRGADGKNAIKIFDLDDEKEEEKTVLDDMGDYRMSADGKKLLVRKGNTFHRIKSEPDQKLEKPISTDNLLMHLEPRQEWRQILREAWRIQRDYFYDPNMHGVDWPKIYDHYAAMLPDCTSREDVSFLISEMISELNVGHAYYGGGDGEDEPNRSVGMLGVDFELHENAYRIAEILEGAPHDLDARSPLSLLPQDQAKKGDYILAVNRMPLDPARDPWAPFIGLANQTVTLTVNDKPLLDDSARDVTVKLLGGDSQLRFRAWIEKNRSYVARKTDGKVGYVYVPNTGVNGQNELVRQFYGQMDKEALIIDERWNGGGQAPTRFIELLHRPMLNYWARRDGNDWPWPFISHQGPKCMLINGLAGSGGDMFPALFRQVGLGKLIGSRTWGGLVGMSGNPRLIDGGYTAVPTFAYYELDGTWGIEGHGVDPDIEVLDDPALMVNGGDPQLDAAIDLMVKEIAENPYTPPHRPAYPDRSGMGIRPEDR